MEDAGKGKKTIPQNETNLGEIYYNFHENPTALGSVAQLRQSVPKNLRSQVSTWLHTQDLYTRTHPRRKKFPMNPYKATDRNQTWEADLLFVDGLRRWNHPFRYLLVVIDVFDRYLWVEKLKSKTAVATAEAFDKILRRASPRKCRFLRTDAGGEFLGSSFQKLLKSRGISHQRAGGIVKASLVERVIRTIKSKLYKIFYMRGFFKYTDILDKVVENYNLSVHSATGFAPAKVTENEIFDIWQRYYNKHVRGPPPKPKFKKNDLVRLQIARDSLNDRGFYSSFTNEVFRIYRVQTKHSTGYLAQPVYHLKDKNNERINTPAYSHELILVQPDHKPRKVEKILAYRPYKNSWEYQVKFRDSNETRFISEEELRRFL